MSRRRESLVVERGLVVSLAAASLLVAGCGGDSHEKTVAATPVPANPPRTIAKPIRPRCATEGFKSTISTLKAPAGQKIWQLGYQAKKSPLQTYDRNKTTIVLIIEQTPRARFNPFKSSRYVQVAGRRVNLRTLKRGGFTQFVTRWRTGRALYTGIANGTSMKTLSRFIGCLP